MVNVVEAPKEPSIVPVAISVQKGMVVLTLAATTQVEMMISCGICDGI
jgi:hypothetical protein